MGYSSNKRTNSACSDADNDYNLAEAELEKLHRQYRILECNRKAYLKESRNIIRKQRSHIHILEKDNAEVDIDLRLARSLSNTKKDASHSRALRKFVRKCNAVKKQIKGEKKLIKQLNRKVGKLEEDKQEKYRTQGGSQVDMMRQKSSLKNNRVLENRLHKATVAFNTTLTTNCDLRGQIEHLRQERALYDSLYRKLMKEQDGFKREMSDVIEVSTLAYDARDEAHSKMTALRDRSEKDQTNYNLELKELKRIIDHEKNLKDFMNVKANERSEQKTTEAGKRQKRADKLFEAPPYAEEMKQFETVMERITETEGEMDLDILVRRFIQKEDANFALYNFVNEVNSSIENMHEGTHNLNEDISTFKKQGLVISDERKKIIKSLESQSSELKNEVVANESAVKKTNKGLDLVKSNIAGICRRIGCDDSSILEKLGSSSGINDSNAMSYLGLIEQMANEFILIQRYQKSKDVTEKGDSTQTNTAIPAKQTGSMTAARLRPVSVASVRIQPPTIENGEDEALTSDEFSDEISAGELQPLSPEQLRIKAIKILQRRERKSKGKTSC